MLSIESVPAIVSTRTRRLWASGAVALGAAALLVVRDPHGSGSFGICPTLLLLGVHCPGCGSLRATHDALTGNLAEAFGHNLLTVPALVWLGWWWAEALASAYGRSVPGPPQSRGFMWGLLAVLAAFTLARNVPGSPLAP